MVCAASPGIQRSAEEPETLATDLITQIMVDGAAVDLSRRIDGTRFESGTALAEALASGLMGHNPGMGYRVLLVSD